MIKDVLTLETDDCGSVNIDFQAHEDHVRISIENEWCGDTETGFGANVGIDLDKEQILEVFNFLFGWLSSAMLIEKGEGE